jgi:iron complex outermembrane receptor protein
MLKGASSAPRSALAYMIGASFLVMASAASAQTAAGSQPVTELDVVIVTANKRAESVQKVAQTVNVVSASTIADLHVQNTIELTQVVGGLSLTMTSPSEQSISLRGIKMPSGGGPSTNTVETYLNEVPISVIDAFATTLDIGQIEVLKGPQGTLRGRPSPSGALTIATQKGSFTDFSGYAVGTLSDHDGQRAEAAFGGPISDTLAYRLAGVYDHNGLTEVKNINNGKSNYQETYALAGNLGLGADRPVLGRSHGAIHASERRFLSPDRGPGPLRGGSGRRDPGRFGRLWKDLHPQGQDRPDPGYQPELLPGRAADVERALQPDR